VPLCKEPGQDEQEMRSVGSALFYNFNSTQLERGEKGGGCPTIFLESDLSASLTFCK